MTAQVYAATIVGFNGRLVRVECDTSNSLPNLVIVGLGNKAIDEARERVRSAIKNSGLTFPRKRITINLAPANLPKDGVHFDVPIAMAILAVSGQVPQSALQDCLVIGELALDGSLRPVRGIISHMQTAKEAGLNRVIIPVENCGQASLVTGVQIIGVTNLRQAYMAATGQLGSAGQTQRLPIDAGQSATSLPSMDDIAGQSTAKRALTIAAAGHHNILLTGPPGSGKTMLAKALLSILPPLSNTGIIEVTKLHSLAGEADEAIITTRPFRSPHHSASHIALLGGGGRIKPGEVSLAHHGVLFLDELPEYSRAALEALRQPLEDKVIHIARTNQRASFPADFMLVATQNPCPCGYAEDSTRLCHCPPAKLAAYQQKLSGPLLDRIDIVLNVNGVRPGQLLEAHNVEHTTTKIAKQVAVARQRQAKRYNSPLHTNANLGSAQIHRVARLSAAAKNLLDVAAGKLSLSSRSYFRTIKVARTIADLQESEEIAPEHLAEALQYRQPARHNSKKAPDTS